MGWYRLTFVINEFTTIEGPFYLKKKAEGYPGFGIALNYTYVRIKWFWRKPKGVVND